MFKKVLVATDFSQCAEQLWNCLGELRESGTEEIILMHAVPLTPPARFIDYAEKKLEERKQEVEKMGFTAKVRVQVGQAPQEILDVAGKEHADLILVGAKGENRIREMFIGNTVRDLIRTGRTPILVERFKFVKGNCAAVSPRKFERVLLPTDFSEASMRVFSFAKDRLAAHVGEVVLVNVVDSGHTEELIEEQRKESLDRLNALRQNLEDAGIKAEVRVRIGIPSQHIIAVSREDSVSMVMLATHGAGNIKELLLGSTAENVVRKCPRSVLLFPAKHPVGIARI